MQITEKYIWLRLIYKLKLNRVVKETQMSLHYMQSSAQSIHYLQYSCRLSPRLVTLNGNKMKGASMIIRSGASSLNIFTNYCVHNGRIVSAYLVRTFSTHNSHISHRKQQQYSQLSVNSTRCLHLSRHVDTFHVSGGRSQPAEKKMNYHYLVDEEWIQHTIDVMKKHFDIESEKNTIFEVNAGEWPILEFPALKLDHLNANEQFALLHICCF